MDIRSVAGGSAQGGQTIAETGSFSADVPSVVMPSGAAPVQTVNAVSQAANVPDLDQAKDAVHTLNEAMKTISPNLEFSMDTDIHRTIVKVVDKQTDQVIRQIPTPEIVEIAKALDRLQGLLIKQQA